MPQYYQTSAMAFTPSLVFSYSAGLGAWADNTSAATFGSYTDFPAGLQYQLLTRFDPQRGLPLDPPSFLTATLAAPRVVGGFGSGDLELYLVADPTPDTWSLSNLPTQVGATLLQTIPVVSELNITFTLPMTTVRATICDGRWRGLLSLVLRANFGAPGAYSEFTGAPTLTTSVVPFTTGINTPEMDRAGRIRTCPRTGRLAFADEFVRDGYIEGAWVHQDSYDPEDRADEYTLPSSEGQIHDEVP